MCQPPCLHYSKVTDSRQRYFEDNVPLIKRRRECLKCGARFTTYEILVEDSEVYPHELNYRKPGRHINVYESN